MLSQAITILGDNPHYKAAHARSLFLKAELLERVPGGDASIPRAKALQLYAEHTGSSLQEVEQRQLTMQSFNNLVSCWQW